MQKRSNLVIDNRDCDTILSFAKEFNVAIPQNLKQAISDYMLEDDANTQASLKIELCRWLVASKDGHEIWNNHIWSDFKEDAARIAYDLEFEKDISLMAS